MAIYVLPLMHGTLKTFKNDQNWPKSGVLWLPWWRKLTFSFVFFRIQESFTGQSFCCITRPVICFHWCMGAPKPSKMAKIGQNWQFRGYHGYGNYFFQFFSFDSYRALLDGHFGILDELLYASTNVESWDTGHHCSSRFSWCSKSIASSLDSGYSILSMIIDARMVSQM